eukprot:2247903-Pyramimonas_sp.AAC.1
MCIRDSSPPAARLASPGNPDRSYRCCYRRPTLPAARHRGGACCGRGGRLQVSEAARLSTTAVVESRLKVRLFNEKVGP